MKCGDTVMKRLGLLLSVLLLSATATARAQQTEEQPAAPVNRRSAAATPQQIARFVANFQAGVRNGCIGNPPQGARNQRGYCTCYAAAFVNRYTPQELVEINRVAGLSNQNPAIIALMMSPEMRECRRTN